MDEQMVRLLLAKKIKEDAGDNESQWSRANNLSQGYVTHVRKGMMPPGGKILAALGLEKIVDYRPIRKPSSKG